MNCVQTKKKPWWSNKYSLMYLDDYNYKGDKILKEHGIRQYLDFRGDYTKDNSIYRFIFVKVPKKYIHEFNLCMKELRDAMMICYGREYEDYFESIINSGE